MSEKRERGRYYTVANPFKHSVFWEWATMAGMPKARVLEPFAGANNLVEMLKELSLCEEYDSYDIAPGAPGVKQRDSLANFPQGFSVCVTNPPWLYKTVAGRQNMSMPRIKHDNLYKEALDRCLTHCAYVAAIVPASYIITGLFEYRLFAYVLLPENMFDDTEMPCALVMFSPHGSQAHQYIYDGDDYIGTLADLRYYLPPPAKEKAKFNAPDGNVGLIGFDNTREASIRFCEPAELGDYEVKHTSRAITKIQVNRTPNIPAYNAYLREFRENTHDIFLTAFKGRRKDGVIRRILPFSLANDIIYHAHAKSAQNGDMGALFIN